MNESKFSKTVCAIIKVLAGHVSRVEAAESAAGIPDLDYCIGGRENHIELKVGRATKGPELRPSQVRWFKGRLKAGGTPFFLCLDTDRHEVYFVEGSKAAILGGNQSIVMWREMATKSWPLGDEFRQGLMKIL